MDNTQRLLLNLLRKEKLPNYEGLDREKLVYTYKMQIFIITCKSLKYLKEGVGIDYDRFNEEMNLFKYYMNGNNHALINYFRDTTFNGYDNSIIYRIIPISLSNHNYKVVEEEVIKNIINTTLSPEEAAKSLFISYIIMGYTEEEIKEMLINFSIKTFADKYKSINKIYILNFERERIKLIQCIPQEKEKIYLKYLKPDEKYNKENLNSEFEKLILSFSDYIEKIKEGKINIEKIKPDKFERKFKITLGNIFQHYLLGKSKIIKITSEEFFLKTKYGVFKFKKTR